MGWTYVDTIPGVAAGGPNPSDAFSMRIGIADLNSEPSDATSFAFSFPESISSASDAASLALLIADTNAALSDSLLRLAIVIAETNSSQSETLSLGINMVDAISAMTDSVSVALSLADTNAALSDALLGLAIAIAESNVSPTDAVTYVMNLLQGDTIDQADDGLTNLAMSGLADSSSAPSDARTSVGYFWLSGTTALSGNAVNPANLNGPNDGVRGQAKTTTLGATTAQYTSNVGNGIPNGTPFSSAIYRGWFNFTAGATSTKTITIHSSSALFTDIVALTSTAALNHDDGSFTFDLVAAGINTLAKLQSVQIIHKVVDSVAGLGGAFQVDAGRIELTNII